MYAIRRIKYFIKQKNDTLLGVLGLKQDFNFVEQDLVLKTQFKIEFYCLYPVAEMT